MFVINLTCKPEFQQGLLISFSFLGKIYTPAAGGAQSRSFLLYHESDPPSNGEICRKFLHSLVPSGEIDISLSECLGHASAGRVFIGSTDYKNFAVKVAPRKIGRHNAARN
jgi:hypothetical protein